MTILTVLLSIIRTMKRFLIVFLVFFVACSNSSEESNETIETTTTTQETTTTSSTTSSTTTTMVEEEYEVDPPKVLITNCPTENINVDVYELEWTAEAGSGDIVYIGILVEKDDANFTRVFFTKEDNADLITFPTAYTSNSYSYEIDNTGSNVAASYIIEINIISEQPNGDQVSTYELCYANYSPPTTTTTIKKFAQNSETLLPKIESLKIIDINSEIPKVEIVVKQGFKISEEALSKSNLIINVEFNICNIPSNNIFSNNKTNYEKCDGPSLATLTTWSTNVRSKFGSYYSYFKAEQLDLYKVKYTLGLFKDELIATGNLESLREEDIFYQFNTLYIWDIKNYGNQGCDIRFTIYGQDLEYKIEKKSSKVECEKINNEGKELYNLNLLEVNNFNELWKGSYFNRLPSFNIPCKTSSSTRSSSTTTTIPPSVYDSFIGSVGIDAVSVNKFNNNFMGTIGADVIDVDRYILDNGLIENFYGTIGIDVVDLNRTERDGGLFENIYGTIGIDVVDINIYSNQITGSIGSAPIDIDVFNKRYAGSIPKIGIIVLLIDYFY